MRGVYTRGGKLMRAALPLDCSTNPNYPAAQAGDNYRVTVAGRVGGASGPIVNVGDLICCHTDNAGGTEAAVGANWFVIEGNQDQATESVLGLIRLATNAEALGGTDTLRAMTPQRVREAVDDRWQVRSGSFTAANRRQYITTATLTITDPSGVLGDSYVVVVGTGTCTLGGLPYQPSRIPLVRYHNGTAWQTLAPDISDNINLAGMTTVNGNLVLNGANNTAPGQTSASSADSIMTRRLTALESMFGYYDYQFLPSSAIYAHATMNAGSTLGMGLRFGGTSTAAGNYTQCDMPIGVVGSGNGLEFNAPLNLIFTYMQGPNSGNVTATAFLGSNDRQNLTGRGIGVRINCGNGTVTAQVNNGPSQTASVDFGDLGTNVFHQRFILAWDGVNTLRVFRSAGDRYFRPTEIGSASISGNATGEFSNNTLRVGLYATGPSGGSQDAVFINMRLVLTP